MENPIVLGSRTPLRLLSLAASFTFLWSQVLVRAEQNTSAPTTSSMPARLTHAQLYAQAKKEPLVKPTYRDENDQPIGEAALQEMAEAESLLKQAEDQRKAGNLPEALRLAEQSLAIRTRHLGGLNPHTVSAIALQRTLKRFAAARTDEKLELKQADELQFKAEKAYEEGEFALAVEAGEKALEIRERILGKNHHELGETLRVLGGALTELTSLDRAQEYLDRGVEIVERNYGKRHPKLARILDRRGWLRINRGDYQGAVEDLQTAYRINRNSVGDTVEAAEVMDNLGTAVAARHEYEDAVNRKMRALVVRERLLGEEARDTAVSYSNLAWLYARMGMSEEVVPLRERALAVFEKVLGADHPYTSTELVNLGLAYQARGRFEDAIRLYEKAVHADDTRSAPPDIKSVVRAARLALTYLESGRRDDGLRALDDAVKKATAVYKQGNAKAATEELYRIASVYETYRRLADATKVFELAHRWDGEIGGDPTDGRIGRAERLGAMYISMGRPDDARKVAKQAMEDAIKLYGKGDKRTAPPMLTLSLALVQLGELREAESICDEVLRISETKVGTGSKANAFALRAMARVYLKQKRLDLAKFALDDARRFTEEHQHEDPVEMIRLLMDYAEWQAAAGDKTGGIESLRDALARCRKLAESVRTPYMDSLLASAMKRLIDALPADDAGSRESDALRAELKAILEKLRDLDAMDAEEKQWLAALGSGSANKS